MDGPIIARLGTTRGKNRKQAVKRATFYGLVNSAAHLNIHKQTQGKKIGD
jgi:hypothetical protein